MACEPIEHERPVHAGRAAIVVFVAPPVPLVGFFVIDPVVVEPFEHFGHRSGLGRGHVVVVSAVQDVHRLLLQVGGQSDGVAGLLAPAQQNLHRRLVGGLIATPAIGGAAEPAGAGPDCGKTIGVGDAKMPGSVAAHGMAGEVNAG